MKTAIGMLGLALCAVGALAHPGALTCGDKAMNLKGTIMGLTVEPPTSIASAHIELSPATYTPGKPVTVKASGWPKGAYIALGVSGPGGAPLAKGSNGTFSGFAASKASATCPSQIYHTTLTAPAVPPPTLTATWTPPAGAKGPATFKLLWSEGPTAAKKYVSIVQKNMAAKADANTTLA